MQVRGAGLSRIPSAAPYVGPGDLIPTGWQMFAGTIRAFSAASAGPKAINVTRAANSVSLDIDTLPSGPLDGSTLAASLSGTSGIADTLYDQVGGNHLQAYAFGAPSENISLSPLFVPTLNGPSDFTGFSAQNSVTLTEPYALYAFIEPTVSGGNEGVLALGSPSFAGIAFDSTHSPPDINTWDGSVQPAFINGIGLGVPYAMVAVYNGASTFLCLNGAIYPGNSTNASPVTGTLSFAGGNLFEAGYLEGTVPTQAQAAELCYQAQRFQNPNGVVLTGAYATGDVYGGGPWQATCGAFNIGTFVLGTDYTQSVTVLPKNFPNSPNGTTFNWNFGSITQGIWSYPIAIYGWYSPLAGPFNAPAPQQISALNDLKLVYNFTNSASTGASTLLDQFITSSPKDNTTEICEIEVFTHLTANIISFLSGLATQYSYTDPGGKLWNVSVNPNGGGTGIPIISFWLNSQADQPSGVIYFLDMFNFLIGKGLFTSAAYFNGFAIGPEIYFGEGPQSLVINSVNVVRS